MRAALVSRLVILIETPGITAPVASVTRPTTLAEGCCALRPAVNAIKTVTRMKLLFMDNPLASVILTDGAGEMWSRGRCSLVRPERLELTAYWFEANNPQKKSYL